MVICLPALFQAGSQCEHKQCILVERSHRCCLHISLLIELGSLHASAHCNKDMHFKGPNVVKSAPLPSVGKYTNFNARKERLGGEVYYQLTSGMVIRMVEWGRGIGRDVGFHFLTFEFDILKVIEKRKSF